MALTGLSTAPTLAETAKDFNPMLTKTAELSVAVLASALLSPLPSTRVCPRFASASPPRAGARRG